VRRERAVWRVIRFGVPEDQQPREASASREEAGVRLLELSTLGLSGAAHLEDR